MVQDSNRLVIASMVQQLPQAYKAVEIEAMAASRASEFGVEIGIHQAILEGDSTLVVTILAEGDTTKKIAICDETFSTITKSHRKN